MGCVGATDGLGCDQVGAGLVALGEQVRLLSGRGTVSE